ncbi:hypothetical protein DFH09DRAFT_1337510 [Mycena vulgaris]|nr:hypothetical protein DFH09DRAFT_1337510 [Mycena vulgaris]
MSLTYGSFGDLIETAKLVVKVVKLLRARGKLSQERLALTAELQTLNSDLITLDSIASGIHLDPSYANALFVIIRIRAEVESCRMVLTHFLDKLEAPRGVFGIIIAALSEESELAKVGKDISRPLKVIRTLVSTLNLSAMQGVGMQLTDVGSQVQLIGSQVLHVGERVDYFGDRLVAYHEAVLRLPIAHGVVDDIFCVVDPIGGNIPISLRYCHAYTDLDRLIKAHLLHRPEAGACYIQRGDYNIVSSEGSTISPVEFTETVRAGMQVEMSIIKRRIQNPGFRIQNTQCPHCHWSNTAETGNDWFKWYYPS